MDRERERERENEREKERKREEESTFFYGFVLARVQVETLLHSLERTAAGIGLYVNAHKTEYMCYNQTGNIATLDGASLKLVDKFTYLGSSVSSTEKDIDTRRHGQLSIGSRSYGSRT